MDFEDIKGSRTEENLRLALQNEALAHLKYQLYKQQIGRFSKKYEKVLDEIIENEKQHAKLWFKLLNGGKIPDNEVNLLDAIRGEHSEYCDVYPEFARISREEGFEDIAELFEAVADIEGRHCEEFKSMLDAVDGEVPFFKSEELCSVWKCMNCGHIATGGSAPFVCPVCGSDLKFFVEM